MSPLSPRHLALVFTLVFAFSACSLPGRPASTTPVETVSASLDWSIVDLGPNDVLNVTRMVFENPTILPTLNVLSSVQDAIDMGWTAAPVVNSYYLEDGSFIRLDNISLGYNVGLKENDWIRKVRVYATANNLLTITGYTGIDPETSYDGKEFGLDMYNVYPKTRSFTFGVQVTF